MKDGADRSSSSSSSERKKPNEGALAKRASEREVGGAPTDGNERREVKGVEQKPELA